MEFKEVIRRRRSYRKGYEGVPVPRKDLVQIVEAGIVAPSGYGAQSTSFVVVDDKAMVGSIAELAGGQEVLTSASAIIVVIMDPAATADKNFCFGIEDYAAATENILLSIVDQGYASVWIDGALRSNNVAEKIGELLSVPQDREVRVILPVGKPTEEPGDKTKRGFGEVAWFNRFGGEQE